MAQLSGGCACGAVRYESDGEVEVSFHCHCRKCQRSTGAGHASAFGLPVKDVTLSGGIREFKASSDSGADTYSGFCPTCGSPILSRSARFPERVYFHAATLDDPSIFSASMTIFEDQAQPWDRPASD